VPGTAIPALDDGPVGPAGISSIAADRPHIARSKGDEPVDVAGLTRRRGNDPPFRPVPVFKTVSYTHLTLPTICSV